MTHKHATNPHNNTIKIQKEQKREKNKQRTRANFANKQSAVTFVCGCGDGRLPMVIKRLGREEDWCEE